LISLLAQSFPGWMVRAETRLSDLASCLFRKVTTQRRKRNHGSLSLV